MYFLTQGDLSKFIKINEQPKDQIIRFKDNDATVELTCIAESPERYDLHYEWYCVNSDCIKSVNCHAKLKLKKPPKNMEEQYHCKVSTANDSRYCLMSKTVVIKLEISKLVAQYKSQYMDISFCSLKLLQCTKLSNKICNETITFITCNVLMMQLIWKSIKLVLSRYIKPFSYHSMKSCITIVRYINNIAQIAS